MSGEIFEDQRLVVEALARVGVHVEQITKLRSPDVRDVRAVPVLAEFVGRDININVKLAILQVLVESWTGDGATEPVLVELQRLRGKRGHDTEELMFALADVVSRHAGRGDMDTLIAIAVDSAYGDARGPILEALARASVPREPILTVLAEALPGPLTWFALRAARRMKAVELLQQIRDLHIDAVDRRVRSEQATTLSALIRLTTGSE